MANQGLMKNLGGSAAAAVALLVGVTVVGNLLMPYPEAPQDDGASQSAPAPESAKKAASTPATAAPAAAGAGANASLPVRLAMADAKRGATVAKKCVACHPLEKDAKAKVGPGLWGVLGRTVATGDFKFSDAMIKAGGNWTFERLDAYIENPKTFAPGNKMAFAGIGNGAERADLLLHLRSLSDSPVALPQASAAELAAAKNAPAQTAAAAPAEPAIPQDRDPAFRGVAGVRPFERPQGVPFLTSVVKSPEWFKHALTGVSEPVPASLDFLKEQEFWFNPFTRPGMPGPYDLRKWHSAAK